MIKFLSKSIFVFFLFFLNASSLVSSQESFYRARVEKVNEADGYQIIDVTFLEGDMKGRGLSIEHGKGYTLSAGQMASEGEIVVVVKTSGLDDAPIYQIIDKYRLDKVGWVIAGFFGAIMILAGWKGVGSIMGMILSLIVIVKFVVPQILAGRDPLIISIAGCFFIMITTIYLAHGLSRKTTIALVATFLTLVGTGLLSVLFTHFTQLTGLGSEEAYMLRFGAASIINFKGLLLGGMMIGTLGVLDDVTTSLSASLFEISSANTRLKFARLFEMGMNIGREHIASLVNTLVLAYAGASLPIFLTLVLNPNGYPLWSILNSEIIMEEIIRTIVGSVGLIAAVPLTAVLTAWYLNRKSSGLRMNKNLGAQKQKIED